MLEHDLFAFLETAADAAFAVDQHGLICSWNRAAEKLFGHPASSVLQKPCSTLFQGRGPEGTTVCCQDCLVRQCGAEHRPTEHFDLEVNTRGGRRLWVNISILLHRDARSGRTLHVHLARDITVRKHQEELSGKLLNAARDLTALAQGPGGLTPVLPLSHQEKNVLRHLAEGQGPREAARALHISDRTLRNHLHHANRKLGTHSRLEAVLLASRRGML
jgi:PAS domain S-box-containing protein